MAVGLVCPTAGFVTDLTNGWQHSFPRILLKPSPPGSRSQRLALGESRPGFSPLLWILESGRAPGSQGQSDCPEKGSRPGRPTEASGLGSQVPGLALLAAMGWLPACSPPPGGPSSYAGIFPCLRLAAATLIPTKLSCHILCLPAPPTRSSHFPSAMAKRSEPLL